MGMRLTDRELLQRRATLEGMTGVVEAERLLLRRQYAPDTPEGRQVYDSYTDEALIALLRQTARRLGHSPTQKEVHWVYRSYFRTRFRNWPTALSRAGLSKAAGQGGQTLAEMERAEAQHSALLAQVGQRTAELGRMPHPSEMPQVCEALKWQYKTWGEVLAAAGVETVSAGTVATMEDLEEDCRLLLEEVRTLAQELNRAPLRREVHPDVRAALIRRCGTWRNALYQIGLEPVRRIAPFSNSHMGQPSDGPRSRHRGSLDDCHYRILRVDEQTAAHLALVERLAAGLGHVPGRREVPVEVRQQLQAACGSWSNALYQLKGRPTQGGEK